MPAPRDEEWSVIAAQAAAGATLETLAEHWNIPLGTLKYRCATEGWKRVAREIQATEGQVVNSSNHTVQPRSSERSVSLFSKLGEKSLLLGAQVGNSTLRAIKRKRDDALIRCAPAFKATVDSLAKIHSWDQPSTGSTVNVQMLNQVVVPPAQAQGQGIE
jgi:hypothetical protein